MNDVFIILVAVAIATVVALYIFGKGADEIKEEKPVIKFEPRKMTDLSKPVDLTTAPKKKYYKKRKKKPAVANNTIVDKKPVGRPRKTTE